MPPQPTESQTREASSSAESFLTSSQPFFSASRRQSLSPAFSAGRIDSPFPEDLLKLQDVFLRRVQEDEVHPSPREVVGQDPNAIEARIVVMRR